MTPRPLAEEKLKSGKKMRLYFGIDPTGNKLHLGHSVPLRKMRAFQDAGHEVIMVIGSFTAMIGDPTGRDEMRVSLTKKDIEQNYETYMDQAKLILDTKKLTVKYNHEWLEKLGFKDIIDLASKFTVQQMIERDMFEKRIDEGKPIGLHEFFYPLMVGYDSVVLDVDGELGGNDQYFNMLAGRTLQTAFKKRDKFVLTTKILEGTDGRKMSKTYDNCVFLTDSPNEMFGKLMRVHDNLMETYFECCTDVAAGEVQKILSGNPKEAKMRLAKEIVSLYHGGVQGSAAEANFNAVFSDGGVPDDIAEVRAKKGMTYLDLLVSEKLVTSKSEGRRLIEQGGLKLDDVKIDDQNATVATSGVLKVGKRKFVKIIVR